MIHLCTVIVYIIYAVFHVLDYLINVTFVHTTLNVGTFCLFLASAAVAQTLNSNCNPLICPYV